MSNNKSNLHFTLGEFPRNLVWNKERAPEHSLDMNVLAGREMILSYADKLEWITKEDTTIFVFLQPPILIGRNHLSPPQTSLTQVSNGVTTTHWEPKK